RRERGRDREADLGLDLGAEEGRTASEESPEELLASALVARAGGVEGGDEARRHEDRVATDDLPRGRELRDPGRVAEAPELVRRQESGLVEKHEDLVLVARHLLWARR